VVEVNVSKIESIATVCCDEGTLIWCKNVFMKTIDTANDHAASMYIQRNLPMKRMFYDHQIHLSNAHVPLINQRSPIND